MTIDHYQNIPSAMPPDKEKRKIVIARVDIERQARDVAEEKLLASKGEVKSVRGIFDRIWKQNLAHEYYRQKEISKAKREITDSGNLYAGESGDRSDHENAMRAIVERFGTEYEDETLLRKGEERRSLKEGTPDDTVLRAKIVGLITRFASDELSEEQFLSEKKKLVNSIDTGVPSQAVYADNLLEIARNVKESVTHGKGLDAIDDDFDIVIGNARTGVETEARYNAVDRITEKIQRSSVGSFVNEATVATAVSIAYGVIAKGTVSVAHRGAKLVGPLGMGLSAGIGGAIAGVRENKKIKDERAQHARERAKGKRIEPDSKRRKEMELFRSETKNAGELAGKLRESLAGLQAQPNERNLSVLLEHLVEIKARTAFSERERIDLIDYSSPKDIERERTDLYVAAAEARVYLRRNSHADWATFYNDDRQLDEYLRHAREAKIRKDFVGEKTVKDEAFEKMKRSKVAWAVAGGLGVGLGVGLASQEIGTVFDGKEGLFGGSGPATGNHQYTALGYLRRYFSGTLPQDEIHTAVPVREVATALSLDAPAPSHQPEALSHEAVVDTREYVKTHEGLFSKIDRVAWADNDTPKPDGNELRMSWGGEHGTGVDAKGNFVFNIRHMTKGGSFHDGRHFDPQALLKEGKMRVLVSLSGDTQGQVVEIPIDADGNAIIDPKSEIGKLAFSTVDGHATFTGKFAEVAIMGDQVDGVDHATVLATKVGSGIEQVRSVVSPAAPVSIPASAAVSVPTTDASLIPDKVTISGYDVEAPAILPFLGRTPLERMKNGRRGGISSANTNARNPAPTSSSMFRGGNTIPAPPVVHAVKPAIFPEPAPVVPPQTPEPANVAPVPQPESVRYPMPKERKRYSEIDPVGAIAAHTLYNLEQSPSYTYEDLNAPTKEEGNLRFAALTRELWNEFTVHEKTDMDAFACLNLMKLAGMKVDMDKVGLVPQGEYAMSGVTMDTALRNGVTAEEGGKRLVFDHHGSTSGHDTSATKFVYEALVKAGLLERRPYLDRFVAFVTKCDNMDLSDDERKRVFRNYHKNLYGLSYRMRTEDVLDLFKNGVDPEADLSEEYLNKNEYRNPQNDKYEPLIELSKHMERQIRTGQDAFKKVEKAGFSFDTGADRFGEILIDPMKNTAKGKFYNRISYENNSNQLEVFEHGYGGFLVWSPLDDRFVLYTKKKMDETSVPGGFSQGFNIRGHMWMKGGNDSSKLTILLKEILSKLSGKAVSVNEVATLERDTPKLERALFVDRKGKEMLALFDAGTLTKDILLDTAEKSKIYLGILLEEMITQRSDIYKQFNPKRKQLMGSKKKGEIERIGIEAVLEAQKQKAS
jgi:hypothetical protein